jgi:lipopolysaccharide transport system ATP-binding protein
VNAITVENLFKKFRIPHEKRTTLFQNIIGIVKRQFNYEEFWALKNINFYVEKGESFGIIGKNGSGKSTLLKILAKVMYPDSGTVLTNGKVASFLELGIGFQSELTAQENVYIYSSILGMGRKETDKKYDEIFTFAELKKFENMKLKNFSSGMYTRLAFATAVHTNPDIMLIDEALAVGDTSFQKKCMEKMNEFKQCGKTIIFVSHSLGSVKSICTRTLLLDKGSVISIGNNEDVINEYMSILDNEK